MTSRKPSARKKQRAAFEEGRADYGDIFAREQARIESERAEREANRRHKACSSKNRYSSRAEAESVRKDCASYGRTGLNIYQCEYCGGWHLTSKDYGQS